MENVDIIVEEKVIEAVIEEKVINVVVEGGRGPAGIQGVGATRLLYVADISRGGNFLGNITVDNVVINNTGKTFTFSGNGTSAIMECNDPAFFAKILSITYYKKTQDTDPYPVSQDTENNTVYFYVGGSAATFRICIEFYNY